MRTVLGQSLPAQNPHPSILTFFFTCAQICRLLRLTSSVRVPARFLGHPPASTENLRGSTSAIRSSSGAEWTTVIRDASLLMRAVFASPCPLFVFDQLLHAVR